MLPVDWHLLRLWLYPYRFDFVPIGLGVLLFTPFILASGESLQMAFEAESLQLERQTQMAEWQIKSAETAQAKLDRPPSYVSISEGEWLVNAKRTGLRISLLGIEGLNKNALDKNPQPLTKVQFENKLVRLQVTGRWTDWAAWVALWPMSLPNWSLSAIDLQSDSQGGVVAQLSFLAPQSTKVTLDVREKKAEGVDPFDANTWTQAQHTSALQHPSYVAKVLPELKRVKEPLEAFATDALEYVGHLSMGRETQALIRVKSPEKSLHRVRVGEYLGQRFGRITAITLDQVWVNEMVFESAGEWSTREVKLPLVGAAP